MFMVYFKVHQVHQSYHAVFVFKESVLTCYRLEYIPACYHWNAMVCPHQVRISMSLYTYPI